MLEEFPHCRSINRITCSTIMSEDHRDCLLLHIPHVKSYTSCTPYIKNYVSCMHMCVAFLLSLSGSSIVLPSSVSYPSSKKAPPRDKVARRSPSANKIRVRRPWSEQMEEEEQEEERQRQQQQQQGAPPMQQQQQPGAPPKQMPPQQPGAPPRRNVADVPTLVGIPSVPAGVSDQAGMWAHVWVPKGAEGAVHLRWQQGASPTMLPAWWNQGSASSLPPPPPPPPPTRGR